MNLLTPSGYKNINDVNVGDQLVAYDTITGAIIHNTLLNKELFTYDMLPAIDDIYATDEDGNEIIESIGMTSEEVFEQTYGAWEFYLINGTWKLFKNQSIWANLKVIHASQLQVDDVIYDDQNNDIIVTSIEEVSGDYWWRLTVSGDHSFIADGIQLHNASRYWSGNATATSLNWSYNTGGITNWGSASGTADNASVPTSTDDVTFDGAGALGNSNSRVQSNTTILSLTFTGGYTANVNFNVTTTLTIAGNFTDNTAHTWTVDNASCYITISAAATINSGGKLWPGNIGMTGTNTKVLATDWTASGQLFCSTTTSTTTLNGAFTLSVAGFQSAFNAALTGAATLRLTGGSMSIGGGGANNLNITTLEFAGNVSVPSFNFGGTTIRYISGTQTISGTLSLTGGQTIDTNPIVWNNVTFAANVTATYTINSLLRVSGTLQMAYNGATTVTGSAGFTVGTINFGTNQGLTLTHTFKTGNTYTVTTALNTISNVNGGATFASSDGTNRVTFILQQGATCNTNISFTRIDNSAGRTINTWNGTVTNSLNVRSFTDLQTVARTFVS